MKTKLSVISGIALMLIAMGVNAQELALSDAQMDGVTAAGVSATVDINSYASSYWGGTAFNYTSAGANASKWGWSQEAGAGATSVSFTHGPAHASGWAFAEGVVW